MPEYAATPSLEVITRGDDVRRTVRAAQAAGQTVGLVPTMGALHAGHLSLVDAARRECDRVVVSVFVNPTQFGPNEDYAKYPRPIDEDIDQLRRHGCDWAFVPDAAEMFPPEFDTWVTVGKASASLEGAIRPNHFRGVATVVLKLFNLMPADRAYFGHKDYQQSLVVRRMTADLNLPIDIRVLPTVREPDGLAMSSRNAYLSPDERRRAVALWQSLQLAEAIRAAGETSVDRIRSRMIAHLESIGQIEIQYIAFLRDGTMDEVSRIDGPLVIAVAARVGNTRLIDNHRLQ